MGASKNVVLPLLPQRNQRQTACPRDEDREKGRMRGNGAVAAAILYESEGRHSIHKREGKKPGHACLRSARLKGATTSLYR